MIPFVAEDMTGITYSSNELRGKVVVLNLWGTFCKPCILEMPELNRLKQSYAEKDVVFVSMSPEDKPIIKKFLKKHVFDFIILPGSAHYMKDFGNTVPQTILIDRVGIVREVHIGTMPVKVSSDEKGEKMYEFRSDDLKAKIDQLLSEQQID
ncbi:TlpA family protein disulfide reductase [Pontibacter sp. JH31]|uniref:TlpA family protein disulfide reductase n=2 Tax=Pontibacter aquaedesilientis TaxID=2766980 RepID=A0ABR7XHZ7_9BACT|nr:TlpA family protein disulfide reductase [Pontibacter aquaedesilientis]